MTSLKLIRKILSLCITVCLLFSVSCNHQSPDEQPANSNGRSSDKLIVFVTNYPLQYFAERIGGPDVEVHFPAPRDIDPAFWNPSPETINKYQQADIIFINGANYEKWTQQATLPESNIINTTAAVKDKYIRVNGEKKHSHGPTGEHSHGSIAFTTWLDLLIADRQAEAILQAMEDRMPNHQTDLHHRYSQLKSELDELDSQLKSFLEKYSDVRLLASHPVYQYFSRRYKLPIKSLHWEPDVALDQSALKELNQLLANHPAQWMIWEAKPSDATIKILKEQGIQSVVYAPCANVPESGDFISTMRENVRRLQSISN